MCVSSVCFRAVNSGRAVIAVFKCAALLVKSLKAERRIIHQRRNSDRSRNDLHLRDIVDVADSGTPRDFRSVGFISVDEVLLGLPAAG